MGLAGSLSRYHAADCGMCRCHNPPAILAAAIWLPHQSDRVHRADLLCKGLQLSLSGHPGDTTHKHLAGRACLSVHHSQVLGGQSMSYYNTDSAWRVQR